jgi:hypothetical protein
MPTQWDIRGMWTIEQSRGGNSTVFVTQVFQTLFRNQPPGLSITAQQGDGTAGNGTGFVNNTDNTVSFFINWDNNTAGHYNGSFDDQGRLFGATYDAKNPGSTAEWHSSKTFLKD